ncbi:hypothetical protein [Archangium sp.]|uniref:hypothetical protein n=1 Tax=Archangium sp. TaxID=1872627 RepID=UPI00389A1761
MSDASSLARLFVPHLRPSARACAALPSLETVLRPGARPGPRVLAPGAARARPCAERLQLSAGELHSLLRDVPGELDQSLSVLLASQR